jgi:thiamine-phosphate pyrophosphorylase
MTTFPSLSPVGERRQARLQDARIGVVVGAGRDLDALERHLRAMCEASADLCLLRDDTATEDELRVAADVFRRVCDDTGVLFVCDRLPGLAVQVGADGVHLGAIDVDPDRARRVVGPDLLVGRATRTREEIDRAGDEDVDYLVVGHGREPGQRGDLVAYAAKRASHPWFAVEASLEQARDLVSRGARRIIADRIAEDDPATRIWDRRRLVAAHP